MPKKFLQKIDSFPIRSNYYSVLKTKFVKKRTFAVDIDGTITENGGGRIHLDALEALRRLNNMGHDVIYVTGRSSVEGFLLSVFGGTTKIAVGENGGCITLESDEHILLGNIQECKNAFDVIKNNLENVKEKHVFPRMTEVVLERTFDLDLARKLLEEKNINVELSDSQYAYHINSPGINKGTGFTKIMEKFSISSDDVIAIGDSATDKENEIMQGYANDATTKANKGSGLNSKKSVLEKGKDNEDIIPEPDNQTGKIARIVK